MSGAEWWPFNGASDGVKWFQRNCGRCRLRVVPGKLEYVGVPCCTGEMAAIRFVLGVAQGVEFFKVVFKRAPSSGELAVGCMLGKCKSRDYVGGRGRKSE
jgi:hypothetical protein